MLVYRHNRFDDYEVVDLLLVTRPEVTTRNGAKKARR
jgi:hypothetical protein